MKNPRLLPGGSTEEENGLHFFQAPLHNREGTTGQSAITFGGRKMETRGLYDRRGGLLQRKLQDAIRIYMLRK